MQSCQHENMMSASHLVHGLVSRRVGSLQTTPLIAAEHLRVRIVCDQIVRSVYSMVHDRNLEYQLEMRFECHTTSSVSTACFVDRLILPHLYTTRDLQNRHDLFPILELVESSGTRVTHATCTFDDRHIKRRLFHVYWWIFANFLSCPYLRSGPGKRGYPPAHSSIRVHIHKHHSLQSRFQQRERIGTFQA